MIRTQERYDLTIQDTRYRNRGDLAPQSVQSFTQADSLITRKYGGTGLGLRDFEEVCGSHGRLHLGGEHVLASAQRFSLCPLRNWPDSRRRPACRGSEAQAHPLTSPLRILVADDSEDNGFLIRSYFKSLPYQLDFAENGVIALERLRTGVYDLALVDVHMPEIDGYAVAERARGP